MEICRPFFGFCFAHGEIGVDDFSGFMRSLPKIDIVYNAPPNPKMMTFWHEYEEYPYTYQEFFDALCALYRAADPNEIYIEVNENRDMVVDFLKDWGEHPYIQVADILYAAPADGHSKRMARCRNETQVVIATKEDAGISFKGGYSYDLLDGAFQRWGQRLAVFDPCIGKGLALRYAIKHGHYCYGIEFNRVRLDCTLEYLDQYQPTQLELGGISEFIIR